LEKKLQIDKKKSVELSTQVIRRAFQFQYKIEKKRHLLRKEKKNNKKHSGTETGTNSFTGCPYFPILVWGTEIRGEAHKSRKILSTSSRKWTVKDQGTCNEFFSFPSF